MSGFDAYRVAQGEELDAEFFNRRFRDVDNRFTALEGVKIAWEEALRVVQDRVLGRSETVIASLRERLVSITELGWLTARSDTEHTLSDGAGLVFIVREEDRDLFTPGAYALLSREGASDTQALLSSQAFDRVTGQWQVTVESFVGPAGPFSDWEIAAVAGSTILQKFYAAQGEAVRDETVGIRDETAGIRDNAADLRDEALTFRNAAQQAAEDANAAAILIQGGPVSTVNGRTGAVVLDKTEVGIGNVADLAPADMPVSTAQQAALSALDLKVNLINRSVVQTMFQLAQVRGRLIGMANGAVDDFLDQTGIDAAASVDEVWKSGAFYSWGVDTSAAAEVMPLMTANNAPAGYEVTFTPNGTRNGNPYYGSGGGVTEANAWRLFDGVDTPINGGANSSNITNLTDVRVKRPTTFRLGAVRVRTGTAYRTDGVQAYATNASWASPVSSNLGALVAESVTSRLFLATTLNPPSANHIIRPQASSFQYSYDGTYRHVWNEVELYPQTGKPFTLQSVRLYTTPSPHTVGMVTVAVKATDGGAIVPAQFTARISRDDGATWSSPASLSLVSTDENGFSILENTGFPLDGSAGTQIKYRVAYTGTDLVEIGGVVVQSRA